MRPCEHAKPRAGARRRLAAARAWPCGPRPLRCSNSWSAAELAAFAALSTLGQLRRVSSRGALRALTTSPALLGAADARRRAPAHDFANTARSLWRSRREAGIEPASRRAPQARGMPPRRLDAGEAASFAKRCRWTAKTRAGGGRSASAAPRSAGLAGSARSAPRELTRRGCPSGESAANEASSATARKREHRRGRGPQGHARAAVKPRTPPARVFARPTSRKN